MRRRDFIWLLGGSKICWPLAASAQKGGQIRRIGLLMIIPEGDPQSRADREALELGLHSLGWIAGRNLDLEYRWSDGDETTLRKYAAELVGMSPDVLMTEGTAAFAAVKRETKSIPTIFVNVSDPVGQGFVASLARPGGNATGFTLFEFSMASKWVEILRELAPTAKHIGFLFNPEGDPYENLYIQAVRGAAENFKIDVTQFNEKRCPPPGSLGHGVATPTLAHLDCDLGAPAADLSPIQASDRLPPGIGD